MPKFQPIGFGFWVVVIFLITALLYRIYFIYIDFIKNLCFKILPCHFCAKIVSNHENYNTTIILLQFQASGTYRSRLYKNTNCKSDYIWVWLKFLIHFSSCRIRWKRTYTNASFPWSSQLWQRAMVLSQHSAVVEHMPCYRDVVGSVPENSDLFKKNPVLKFIHC